MATDRVVWYGAWHAVGSAIVAMTDEAVESLCCG